ncbi:Serine/threonine protein kinase [Streptomyces zhaozhouensis]|uniref:Serine/threonine protein kinase n=1 Tax=Streptomyces zhaozhouensis TaxID=1300267 RepID=A0A286DIR0_9ACTN|nr:protein kinase [Streptomyces zhaozhouensis]SOD58520.1 Serine/threonine protein kinase [Streptomyces zhaozhouensis]
MKPLEPADPRELGGYRLLARLGAGGMGRVYLGRAPDGRTVAVKLIHPHFAFEPEFRRRFRQEAAAVQRVSGEWTMPVLGADTEAEVPWLATGFVPGPALTRAVDELHGALPEFSVWRLAEGLARALMAIHGAGVTHRDLKPSNVLITLDGPRVIDFGIARATDGAVATRTGVAIGSPGYMSPEQVRGERLTFASDVFGLGAVLAYAATGEGPFGTRDSAAHSLMHRVVAEPPTLDGLSGPIRDLVERCLAKDPSDRPDPEEIAKEAERHQDPDGAEGVWLPPALTAQLGKEAARLLALSGPTDSADAAAPTRWDAGGAPYTPTAPASSGDATPQGAFGPPLTVSDAHAAPTEPATPAAPVAPLPAEPATPPPPAAPSTPVARGGVPEFATASAHAAPTEIATPPAADTAPPVVADTTPPAADTTPPAADTAPPSAPTPDPEPASRAEPSPAPADVPSPATPSAPPPGNDRGRGGGPELSPKSKAVMGWLQVFFGVFGLGRFYSGHWGVGLLQFLTAGGAFFWGFVDGILILKSDERLDGEGRLMTRRRRT